MSVWEGLRQLRGAAGTTVTLVVLRGNAAEPHDVELTREVPPAGAARGAAAPAGDRLRARRGVRGARRPRCGRPLRNRSATARRRLVVDLRGAARGPFEAGIEAARLVRGAPAPSPICEARGEARAPVSAAGGRRRHHAAARGADRLRHGRRGRAVRRRAHRQEAGRNASANARRAAWRVQRLFPLPDGGGLWMSHAWYFTPAGAPSTSGACSRMSRCPQPDVEFGAPAAPGDPTLDKAIERLRPRSRRDTVIRRGHANRLDTPEPLRINATVRCGAIPQCRRSSEEDV